MKKIKYQEDAVKELVEKTKNLLVANIDLPTLIFKAPTGSGKTYMCSEFIKTVTNNPNFENNFSFIWVAPNKLEDQSYKSLKRYFAHSNDIKCSKKEDVSIDKHIKENEILFINWQSINQEQNILRRASEHDPNLEQIITNTKKYNRKIILFIDEIHANAGTNISKDIINKVIAPDVILGVSATPSRYLPASDRVEVPIYKVREQGMIKEFATINPGYKNEYNNKVLTSGLGGKSDNKVIEAALKKRDQIKKFYSKINKKINPLIIIQIPNSSSKETTNKQQIENELIKFNITTQNEKLAKMLSNDKENYSEKIKEELDNKIEVLICKQAINIGWDCPRAQILVALRNWGNETFQTQTVGRIMRMPEQMHYKEKILNRSYIFTNLKKVSIDREDNFTEIRTKNSKIVNEDAKKITLRSVYSTKTEVSAYLQFKTFYKIFLDKIDNRKINFSPKRLKTRSIENQRILENSPDDEVTITANQLEAVLDIENYKLELRKFIISKIDNNFFSDHFMNTLKKVFYKYFYKFEENKIINIICDTENRNYISNIIDQSLEEYKKNYSSIITSQLKINNNWKIENECSFTDKNKLNSDVKKNIFDKFYCLDTQSNVEKNFIKKLEKSSKVKWWHKNGDSGASNFAVPYDYNKTKKPFFIDFIVKFKNGKIGFFDTKLGFTLKQPDTPCKNKGLLNYVKTDKNYVGGIITNNSDKYHDHQWRIFSGKSENISKKNHQEWKSLDF